MTEIKLAPGLKAVSEKELRFGSQLEGEATLLLSWRTAQRLRRVVDELPPLGPSIPFTVTADFPRAAVPPNASVEDVLAIAESINLELVFPNLPENLFERLALRFRPFYAQQDETHFLSVLALIGAQNEDLRPVTSKFKDRWKNAIFWGAMGMPLKALSVNAENVIKAGFYSTYFHVSRTSQQECEAYEAALGRDIFRVAVVSSVWQRSRVVLEFIDGLVEPYLLARGILSVTEWEQERAPHLQPEVIRLKAWGGKGSLQISPGQC